MVLDIKGISRIKLKNEALQGIRTSLENLQEGVLQEERGQGRKKEEQGRKEKAKNDS